MLQEWLDELSVTEFRRAYLAGKRPYSRPGSARAVVPLCSWDSLDLVLKSRPSPDVLVVSRGVVQELPTPGSLAQLRGLFREGVGLVIREAHRQHDPLLRLCQDFARDLPGEQRILLFATPQGTHGFGWHYDAEEVFIVQTAGSKQYLFRENTVVPAPQPGLQPDFTTIRHETSPLFSCTLEAGDWLYLPRGTWHVAKPLRDSLSISIGVIPERASRIV